jgi:hypothetical protein
MEIITTIYIYHMYLNSHRYKLLFLAILYGISLSAQSGAPLTQPQLNAIQTALPFLTVTPDARSGALGNTGVASSPDVHSQNWNSAKYSFIEANGGVALSYSPHLRTLIGNNNHYYLSGYKRLNNKQVLSGSFRLFTLGKIVFPSSGTEFRPYHFAIDLGYSRLLTDNFSGGIVFRFIRSDLTGGQTVGGGESKAAMAMAGDLGFYYRKSNLRLGNKDGILGLGIQIANMGNKVSYTADQEKSYLPINMRLGGALMVNMDGYNSISLMADLNKLLVPTPPVWATDSLGSPIRDADGNQVIAYGKNPFVAVPVGMSQSFYDAPGVVMDDGNRSVWREEVNEITISLGIEYLYRKKFAFRGGYSHEHETKGFRKYFTTGVGLKFNVIAVDVSYLIPLKSQSPYRDTFIFSLSFEFGGETHRSL